MKPIARCTAVSPVRGCDVHGAPLVRLAQGFMLFSGILFFVVFGMLAASQQIGILIAACLGMFLSILVYLTRNRIVERLVVSACAWSLACSAVGGDGLHGAIIGVPVGALLCMLHGLIRCGLTGVVSAIGVFGMIPYGGNASTWLDLLSGYGNLHVAISGGCVGVAVWWVRQFLERSGARVGLCR